MMALYHVDRGSEVEKLDVDSSKALTTRLGLAMFMEEECSGYAVYKRQLGKGFATYLMAVVGMDSNLRKVWCEELSDTTLSHARRKISSEDLHLECGGSAQ